MDLGTREKQIESTKGGICLRGELKMGIRSTPYFSELSFPDFSPSLYIPSPFLSFPSHYTFIHSADGYWTQKHFRYPFPQLLLIFQPLWSGSHAHHHSFMLPKPIVTFRASSLLRVSSTWNSWQHSASWNTLGFYNTTLFWVFLALPSLTSF